MPYNSLNSNLYVLLSEDTYINVRFVQTLEEKKKVLDCLVWVDLFHSQFNTFPVIIWKFVEILPRLRRVQKNSSADQDEEQKHSHLYTIQKIPQMGLSLGYTELCTAKIRKNVTEMCCLIPEQSERREGEVVQWWDVFVGWVLVLCLCVCFCFHIQREWMWNHAVWASGLPSSGEQTLKTRILV